MSEGERSSPESTPPLPLGPREPTKKNYTPAILHEGKHYIGPYHDAAYRAMASELDISGDAFKRAVFESQLGFVIGGVFYNDRDAMKIFKASVDPRLAEKIGTRTSLTSETSIRPTCPLGLICGTITNPVTTERLSTLILCLPIPNMTQTSETCAVLCSS